MVPLLVATVANNPSPVATFVGVTAVLAAGFLAGVATFFTCALMLTIPKNNKKNNFDFIGLMVFN
jgi:hypothetical protein